MTTWSPQSTCGVKLGLCLPRRMLATIVATRPTTRPSASIRCHFFSTSAGFADLVVFISAFMGVNLFLTRKAAPEPELLHRRQRRYLRLKGKKSRKTGCFSTGKIIPINLGTQPKRLERGVGPFRYS